MAVKLHRSDYATGNITYSCVYYRQYRQCRGGLIVKQNVSNSAQCGEMNFLIFFQPHLRLIYVFLCDLSSAQ